jgi:hypothetical protein
VIPERNPNHGKLMASAPGAPGKSTTAKPGNDEFLGLQGWKARGFNFKADAGVVTVTPTNDNAFMGVGPSINGPATLKFRVRSAAGGDAKIEWINAGEEKNGGKPQSVAYSLNGGDWHEVSVSIPAKGAIGILRLYFPTQKETVEIDWIEAQGKGGKKRWDF